MITLGVRGTFGYMAPEGKGRTVIQEWGIQAEYTFQLGFRMGNPSRIYFPAWVYKQLVGSGDLKLGNMNEEEEMLIKKM
ncbi:hypothetical protein AMTR_s00656p00005410, partial [Amborella trichopoda]